ncbi:MAG: Ig domain-containing protein [Candidatus Azambacteria bacterium]|nr:Ig domain-containing protein [Candidatus Azambacteria bacterium]
MKKFIVITCGFISLMPILALASDPTPALNFTVLNKTARPVSAALSISYILGKKDLYTAGEKINLVIRGVELSDQSAGTPSEGFNVQVYLRSVKDSYYLQGFNAIFNERTQYWEAQLVAPADISKTYLVDSFFYCSNSTLACGKIGYLGDSQVVASFTFKVTGTGKQPVMVLSPNGKETYQIGRDMPIKWTADCGYGPFFIGFLKGNTLVHSSSVPAGVCSPGQLAVPYHTSWQIPATLSFGDDYKIWIYGSINAGGGGFSGDTSNAPFSIVAAKLNITPKSLSNGKVGTKYSKTLKAHGGKEPYKFGISTADSNIPPGLSLLTDGTISGIPTKVGTYNFTVGATSADGISGDQKYKIVIAPNSNAVTARLIGGNITSSTTESIIMRIMLKNNTDVEVIPNTLKLNFVSLYPTKLHDVRITGENGKGIDEVFDAVFPPVYTKSLGLGYQFRLPPKASREIQVRAKAISYNPRAGNIKITVEHLTVDAGGNGKLQVKGFPMTNSVPKNVLIMIRDNIGGTATAVVHSFDWVFGN